MRIIAINGSPRKKRNTATLLEKVLEGAASKDAETELIHLHDLQFKGCASCFACKRIGGASYGKCALKDGLSPVLEKIASADALVIGSPIYFGNVTGGTRSFIERLLFQYLVYDGKYTSLAPKKINTACIYTMNVDEERMNEMNYRANLKTAEFALSRTFGTNEVLYCNDTFQFDDYSKYESSGFDPAAKGKVRDEQFPADCEYARKLGERLALG
jgi:multimeric flavodoxin WrbA